MYTTYLIMYNYITDMDACQPNSPLQLHRKTTWVAVLVNLITSSVTSVEYLLATTLQVSLSLPSLCVCVLCMCAHACVCMYVCACMCMSVSGSGCACVLIYISWLCLVSYIYSEASLCQLISSQPSYHHHSLKLIYRNSTEKQSRSCAKIHIPTACPGRSTGFPSQTSVSAPTKYTLTTDQTTEMCLQKIYTCNKKITNI